MSDSDIPIRAVSRALAVLRAINRHGALTIMQAARETALPYPTACRVIQTLVYEGVIEREPTRKYYRPTSLSQSLSCGYQTSSRLVSVARPHLERLTSETSWPLSLETRVGSSMVLRDSTYVLTTNTYSEYFPGYAMPMLRCATGLAYLAFCNEEFRTNLLERINGLALGQSVKERTTSIQYSEEFFKDVRERGYAFVNRSPFTNDAGKTSAIAVPICKGGEIVGAMALIYFSSVYKPKEAIKRYAGLLTSARRRIGDEMMSLDQHKDERAISPVAVGVSAHA